MEPPQAPPPRPPFFQTGSEPFRSPHPRTYPPLPKDRYGLYLGLFLLTLFTTTLVGAEWATNTFFLPSPDERPFQWENLPLGLPYALAFLSFLLVHEFGHYFAARYHRVPTSLPYCIPIFIPKMLNIGSFGAVIRIRRVPETTRKFFDIGVAGPLAGFVVGLGILIYGFLSLPPKEYILPLKPEYGAVFHGIPSEGDWAAYRYVTYEEPTVRVGSSLLFWFFEETLADPARMPSHVDIFHYPFLFVGFLTLFFTALNLLPIGQLDGGHVVYGLIGVRRAGLVSRAAIVGLLFYGGLGLVDFSSAEGTITFSFYLLYLVFILSRLVPSTSWLVGLTVGIVAFQQLLQLFVSTYEVHTLWLLYAFLTVRLVKPDHPRAVVEQPLDLGRKLVGWLAILIFILCLSPSPVEIVPLPEPDAHRVAQTVR